MIGGKKQDGDWKLDARFNKPDLIERVERVERIALLRAKISLYNLDAAHFIKSVVPVLPRKTLDYLDPPYFVKGQGLYEHHYTHADHQMVAKLVASRLKRPWIVSYDHAPEIVALYPQFRSIVYGIHYSAQDRYQGAEVMFFSDKLLIPDV